MRILLDGGAYASSSTAVTSNAASFAVGPYAVENALIESTCVYTNNPPCGAMRGFGAVQACFAAEAQMDRLASALDIDPVELRLLNALKPGDTLPTGQVIDGSMPVAEVIRGSAEVHCAAAEVGQGVGNVILQVARTELGTQDVALAAGTTASVASSGSAS